MSKTDIKTYPYFDPKRKCMVVKAVTEYAAKPLYAFAYTDPADAFNQKQGEFIATKRLEAKVARKRAKSMRRKAQNYSSLFTYYSQELARVDKERTKALQVALKRDNEANAIEKELEDFLKNI